MKLPIEQIPNTNPPKFRWWQKVPTPAGLRLVKHEGTLPTTVEQAVLKIIQIATEQQELIIKLQGQVKGHTDRIAAQSEIITKQAEKPTEKKGKGK